MNSMANCRKIDFISVLQTENVISRSRSGLTRMVSIILLKCKLCVPLQFQLVTFT